VQPLVLTSVGSGGGAIGSAVTMSMDLFRQTVIGHILPSRIVVYLAHEAEEDEVYKDLGVSVTSVPLEINVFVARLPVVVVTSSPSLSPSSSSFSLSPSSSFSSGFGGVVTAHFIDGPVTVRVGRAVTA